MSKSSSHPILSAQPSTIILPSKFLAHSERFPGICRGLLVILQRSSIQLLAVHGSRPASSQQNMIPADQMSHLVVQGLFLSICGAMQRGVPATVCRREESYSCTYRASPKSASLNYPRLLTRMLAGLRSRWMTPRSTRQLSPETTCRMMSVARCSSRRYLRRYWLRSIWQYYITMKRLGPSSTTSTSLTIFGWSSCRRIEVQFLIAVSMQFCRLIVIYLIAKGGEQYTRPNEPWPITDCRMYSRLPVFEPIVFILAIGLYYSILKGSDFIQYRAVNSLNQVNMAADLILVKNHQNTVFI